MEPSSTTYQVACALLEVRVAARDRVAVEHDLVVGAAADAHRVVIEHEALAEQRRLLRVDHDQAVVAPALFGGGRAGRPG